jgi:3-methyl-2-oxobutanoate hydroxymethyltransferase
MKPILIPKLLRRQGQEKLTCLTGYDAFHATLLDESPVDMILVGDTLGLTVQGHDSTLPVTLEEIIYHARIVARCAPTKLVIVDMPFGSLQADVALNVEQSIRVFKDSGAGALKMEGATTEILTTIRHLTPMGVPVCGHIGFQPQSVHLSGYKIDGKTLLDQQRLLEEAQRLQNAGCFAIVLECVVDEVAEQITQSVDMLTIGIGSGPGVDAQVLVLHDLLGMSAGRIPSFVRQYSQLRQTALQAVNEWVDDVRSLDYPNKVESYQPSHK